MTLDMAKFYASVIRVYENHGVPEKSFMYSLNTMFNELAAVDSDDLSKEHVDLMELASNKFSEFEDFDKAQALFDLKEAAIEVFKSRDEHLKLLNNLKKKNDDEQTDTEA